MEKEKDYLMIGERILIGDREYFSPDYWNDGLSYGTFFKDERAFVERPDSVCYVPESHFEDRDPIFIRKRDFYCVDGYSRNQLQDLIVSWSDFYGGTCDIRYLFDSLTWMSPDTRLNEMFY